MKRLSSRLTSRHDSSWIVHKFGGTSLADAAKIQSAAKLVFGEKNPCKKAVVVSAMSGVTNTLINIVQLTQGRNKTYANSLESLKKKHCEVIAELLSPKTAHRLETQINNDIEDIDDILKSVWHLQKASEETTELVSGYGELWCAQIFHAHLVDCGIKAQWLDARKVLIVNHNETGVAIDWKISHENLVSWLKQENTDALVITGFIASSSDGTATTLKRNGSDFSASIFGSLLGASEITIWTDVDGVLSADPRLVPEAIVLDELSYNEATELAYFGAKVIHPNTMAPAIGKQIPIWIRNTFNPSALGTKIHGKARSDRIVKGFASINQIALVNVEGTGMIGVPGVSQRLFGALREVNVSVIMISQASSEHSICFAVTEKQATLTKQTVERAFHLELKLGQIERVEVTLNCSILAAVGDNMIAAKGVAGRFFTALGRAGVNIRAIAQGSSERNISVVVETSDCTRALRAAHAAFYLSNQTISIGLIGPGLIGGTLLKQLNDELEILKTKYKTDLRVRGIMNSKHMVLSDSQINLKKWKEFFASKSVKADVEKFAEHIQGEHLPHSVIIDCTSSTEIPRLYPKWLEQGLHIVTPNKKANTESIDFYNQLRKSARLRNRHYLYETTVGAGLPVINTLKDLVQTGDQILQLEGVLSGTLSFIFNSFTGERSFSEIVLEAKKRGYTEPDPRDDLSGMDVARKLVILAREAGLKIELSDVQVESLVPENLRKKSAEDFLKALPSHDKQMNERLRLAQKQNGVLRYVAVFGKKQKPSVSLRVYAKDHPFGRLSGTDNIFSFKTERYFDQPLIIQGPGAGPEVTAAGVFADLLRLVSYVGSPE